MDVVYYVIVDSKSVWSIVIVIVIVIIVLDKENLSNRVGIVGRIIISSGACKPLEKIRHQNNT